jgi:hypothetical protein
MSDNPLLMLDLPLLEIYCKEYELIDAIKCLITNARELFF